ncbi:MAG: PilT/PilU family type 4a pilus ATPase [Pirellulaceae bacterium]
MQTTFAAPPIHPQRSDACAAELERLLSVSVETGASDLHLSSGLPPMQRINGEIFALANDGALTAEQLDGYVSHLACGTNLLNYETTGSLDGAISSATGVRFRFNIYRRQNANSIALRRLEDRLHSLADLGLSEKLYEVCDHSHGLVVVAGPTGSGKSTTLAAFLDRINQTRRTHIITIEDPIEYLHPPRMALVNQRQIGTDASSFNDALVAAMRQDPDVILVGEIRDLSTIRTAITAAETGHLVFTTVHAGSCIGTIERLVSVFPADEQPGVRQQLALVMRWIIAQQLVIADGPAITESTQATGIASRRRVVASEVLRNTDAVANLIATAKTSQIVSSMEAGGSLGMKTMEHDLARLWNEGYLTEATASRLSRNADIMRERAEKIRRASSSGRIINRQSH